MRGWSVGQLLALTPEQRARQIAVLSADTRLRLAHLASLGLRRELTKAQEYRAVLEDLTTEQTASCECSDPDTATMLHQHGHACPLYDEKG